MERNASVRSQYSPPSVETVLEFSDDDAKSVPSRRSTVSTTSSLKKTTRRRYKVNGSGTLSYSSASSAEKERRKSARRSRSKANLLSSPTSKSPSREPRTDSLSEHDPTSLEKEVGKHYPRLGSIVGVERGKDGGQRRRTDSTGSISSPASPTRSDLKAEDASRERAHWTEKLATENTPYQLGSKMAASVTSNLTALSSMTNASGGSSGSNSTITQEKVSRARAAIPKTADRQEEALKKAPESQDTPRADRQIHVTDAKPSVFSFMEEGSASIYPSVEWTVGPTSAPAQHRATQKAAAGSAANSSYSRSASFTDEKHGAPRSSTASSFHSDSGISMRDDSPDRSEPVQTSNPPRPASRGKSAARDAFEPVFARQRERAASGLNASARFRLHRGSSPSVNALRDEASAQYERDLAGTPDHPYQPMSRQDFTAANRPLENCYPQAFPSHPDPFVSGAPPMFTNGGTPVQRPTTTSPPAPQSRPSSAEKQAGLSGYGLLASKLCCSDAKDADPTANLVPVYRKFEVLNHRLFLHLQDEIAELEEELRLIDEADALSRTGPASRRDESRNGRDLGWRKMDVLGRVFTKVGHYSKWLVIPPSEQQLIPV